MDGSLKTRVICYSLSVLHRIYVIRRKKKMCGSVQYLVKKKKIACQFSASTRKFSKNEEGKLKLIITYRIQEVYLLQS